jgi:hypothetical protein
MIGMMTPRLAELTDLEVLTTVDTWNLYGKIPPEFFTLPKLVAVSFEGAIQVDIPSTITPTLRQLYDWIPLIQFFLTCYNVLREYCSFPQKL